MQIKLDGTLRHFTDVRRFRTEYGLPGDFGVATFEPKDYTGLASLDHAGDALAHIRDTVLNAIPDSLTTAALMDLIPKLTAIFRRALYTVNERVNLKDVEIDFAVSGFGDVLQRLLYARIRAEAVGASRPDFTGVYQAWLYDSVRVSSTVHQYTHQDRVWQVQVVNHAYGRVGLIVRAGENAYYVHDGTLACPAEGYMTQLLAAVAQRIS